MSTHCNLESQITWTCESGSLTEELRRHLKVGLENLTLAFLSGPEAQWQAGRAGRCLGRYALTPTVTQLLFEVWEDSLPKFQGRVGRRQPSSNQLMQMCERARCTVRRVQCICIVHSVQCTTWKLLVRCPDFSRPSEACRLRGVRKSLYQESRATTHLPRLFR